MSFSGHRTQDASAEKKSSQAPHSEKRSDGHALDLIERNNTILCIEKGYEPPKHRVPARWKKYLLRWALLQDVLLCYDESRAAGINSLMRLL